MGLSISCPFADYDDLDEHIESLTVKSFSFKDDSVKTIVRSVSFKKGDSETKILKSLGSGEMIVEGSVSFRGLDPFNLETMVSVKAPSLSTPKDNAFRPASFKGRETENQVPVSNTLIDANPIPPTAEPSSPKHEAAVKLQKVYKSFRTRRRLADCAVLAEQCWWKLLDFAELKRSSISFFQVDEPETAVSRWSRARTRVAKVGKGLSKDEKARQLALQHWLEAIDPRHRYGHNLHFYYENWLHCESRQPFFYWLDVGEGKEVNLEQCSRSKLQKQCIKYLGPKEREAYEVVVEDGKFVYKKNGKLLDTSEEDKDSKWIFVLSTSKALYVGKKKKGKFQHSSFLAGGATSAAGRLVVENGILKAVWPQSGHYRPTKENFQEFMNFLREKNVDLTDVKESPVDEDDYSLRQQSCYSALRSSSSERDLGRVINNMAIDNTYSERDFELKQSQAIKNESRSIHLPKITHPFERSENEGQVPADSLVEFHLDSNETLEESSTPKQHYKLQKRNLFEVDKEDEVPPESILHRINSHKGMELCQLGKQLSCKWTTGAGPRIGCVRDYPTELQFRALEQVNLSPRSAGNSRACSSPRNMMSPRPKTLIMTLLKENKSTSSFCDPPAPFQC